MIAANAILIAFIIQQKRIFIFKISSFHRRDNAQHPTPHA